MVKELGKSKYPEKIEAILAALAELPINQKYLSLDRVRLRRLRIESGFNQTRFGEGILSQFNVSRVELGLRPVRRKEAEAFATRLNTTLFDLLNPQ